MSFRPSSSPVRSGSCRNEQRARAGAAATSERVDAGPAALRARPDESCRICAQLRSLQSLQSERVVRGHGGHGSASALLGVGCRPSIMDQPLLTPASVALSLSPPRTPPFDSHVRKLYATGDPTAARRHLARILQTRDDLNNDGDAGGYQSHTLASRVLQLKSALSPWVLRNYPTLPLHPHLPSSLSLPDQVRGM